jgi:isochorismate hydrolase
MKVSSILTLVLTGVFAFLCIIGTIDADAFMDIFRIVIVFYFGTKHGEMKAKTSSIVTEEEK